MDYACRLGACLVRGLGEFTDYPAEKSLFGINSRLRPEVKTVFLMTSGADNQTRSSMVREAVKYRFGWRGIRDTVPRATLNAVILKLMASRRESFGQLLYMADLSRYFHRPYHNLEHLIYMLDMAELWTAEGAAAGISTDLFAAILYHDLLVDSDPDVDQGQDVSGTIKEIKNMDLPGCSAERVRDLIQVTDHRDYAFSAAQPRSLSEEQRLMLKLDLAVLGESPYEYGRYARAIAEEYAPKCGGHLSRMFKDGRRVFLQTLLKRVETGELVNPEFDRRIMINARRELDELSI